MKICMAAPYEIKNPRSWSGTPLSLYHHISKLNDDVYTLNLSQLHTPLSQNLNTLKFLDAKAFLKDRQIRSKLGPASMNPLNSKLYSSFVKDNDFDAIIQFGGFKQKNCNTPYYVYTDASHDLKLRFYRENGKLPFNCSNENIEDIKRGADYVREIYQKADGVFCMSQWLAQSMEQDTGVDRSKIHVTYAGPNWHGVDFLQHSHKEISGKNEFHLVLVGVDYYLKGIDVTIKAVNMLNEMSNSKFYLHVCGVKEIYDESQWVINHSFLNKEQLVKVLESCDLFVLPSRFDCFGISFIEAMYCGLPCVGRRLCAMPEIIDEGENGELVESDNPKELADKIYTILSNEEKYKSYSQSALKKAYKFDWDKISSDITKIISKSSK